MRVFDFAGGLGDIFMDMYLHDVYNRLATVEDGAIVTVRSENPFAVELFDHHPNRGRLFVSNMHTTWHEDWWARAGLPRPEGRGHRGDQPVHWYPAPADVELVAALPRPYIVFAAYTGRPAKSPPPDVVACAVRLAENSGYHAVQVGRNYRHPHGDVRTETVVPGTVNLIDRLTVPGLKPLLDGAAAVYASYSSVMLLSWLLRRPTYTVAPATVRHEWERRFAWTFGQDFPENRHEFLPGTGGRGFAEFLVTLKAREG